jgi:hypothetical protein
MHFAVLDSDECETDYSCKTKFRAVYICTDLDELILSCFEELVIELLTLSFRGSSNIFSRVIRLDLLINSFEPIKGGCFELPDALKSRKSIVSTENSGNLCFVYSLLAKFESTHKGKPKTLEEMGIYNFKGISFPLKLCDIGRVEKLNDIGINIFAYEVDVDGNELVFPMRVSSKNNKIDESRMHDLLITATNCYTPQGDLLFHYSAIINFNSFIRPFKTKCRRKIYTCKVCFSHYKSTEELNNHIQSFCTSEAPHIYEMPKKRLYAPTLKFTRHETSIDIPFYVAFDTESAMIDFKNKRELQPDKSGTIKIFKHDCILICAQVVTMLEKKYVPRGIPLAPQIFFGKDAAAKFVGFLNRIAWLVSDVVKREVPLNLTEEEERDFQNATHCAYCKMKFYSDKNKARHHLHQGKGKYLGASCFDCNIRMRNPKFIPILAHCGSAYDFTYIISNLNFNSKEIKVLAKSSRERFLCIEKETDSGILLRFMDTFHHSVCNLKSLGENVPVSERVYTNEYFRGREEFIQLKAHFPFEIIDSIETLFTITDPPPREAFTDLINGQTLSQEEYEKTFLKVWHDLKMKNMYDYYLYYCTLDVLNLSNWIRYYSITVHQEFDIWPFYYLTAPALSFNSALKYSGVELELLSSVNKYQFIQKNVKGGITSLNKSYFKANNKYLPDYDATKASSFVYDCDYNSMYATVLSMNLPHSNFRWGNPLLFEAPDVILGWHPSCETGAFLSVDIVYPKKLHLMHNQMPLLFVRQETSKGQFHLVPTLESQTNYFVHIWYLRFLIIHGLKLKKVHRVLLFTQKSFFKTFIELNIKKREKAANKTISQFHKLINNSLFGRTMMRNNRRIIKVVNNYKQARKYLNDPFFEGRTIYNENLVSIFLRPKKVYYGSPLAIGVAVLEMSKCIFLSTLYEHIYHIFNPNNVLVLYCDTDNFILALFCEDVYKQLESMCLLDASNYPSDHPLFSTAHKKQLGYLSDQFDGRIIHEFVGLACKLYSVRLCETEKVASRGVRKIANLKFDQFKQCLINNDKTFVNYHQIENRNLELRTVLVQKLALRCYNPKKICRNNGIDYFSYGNYYASFPDYAVPNAIASCIE